MAIFNSYVKLPEGILNICHMHLDNPRSRPSLPSVSFGSSGSLATNVRDDHNELQNDGGADPGRLLTVEHLSGAP